MKSVAASDRLWKLHFKTMTQNREKFQEANDLYSCCCKQMQIVSLFFFTLKVFPLVPRNVLTFFLMFNISQHYVLHYEN